MKKINLLEDKISVDTNSFMQAINSKKLFAVTIEGAIIYDSFEEAIVIFQGSAAKPTSLLQASKTIPVAQILGGKYHVELMGDHAWINAAAEWQRVLELNKGKFDYEDSSSDGIDSFKDAVLEEYAWKAADFDITIRDIIEEIEPENKVQGYLVCIETLNPYNFSGFGIIQDIEQARQNAVHQIQKLITLKIEQHPHFEKHLLDDDMIETARFFGVEI